MEVQNSTAEIQGVLLTIDTSTGKCVHIERVRQLSTV
jgi:calcineurin-like phosphoesterase